MSQNSQTMLAVLLVVGLVIGSGIGYFMAPVEIVSPEAQECKREHVDEQQPTDDQYSKLTSLIYGAIGASLVAALAAIVTLMEVSRKIVG